MLHKTSRDWINSDRGWVSPIRKVGAYFIAARLQAKGPEFEMVVAGRTDPRPGQGFGQVVKTPLKTFPSRDQMNACVNDAEEVLTRYLQSFEYNLKNGFPDADDAFNEGDASA